MWVTHKKKFKEDKTKASNEEKTGEQSENKEESFFKKNFLLVSFSDSRVSNRRISSG